MSYKILIPGEEKPNAAPVRSVFEIEEGDSSNRWFFVPKTPWAVRVDGTALLVARVSTMELNVELSNKVLRHLAGAPIGAETMHRAGRFLQQHSRGA